MAPHSTGTLDTIETGDLDTAVDAALAALAALRAAPASPEVADAVARAGTAVGRLGAGFTAEALRRLLVSIGDCHRDGVAQSARLSVCRRSTAIALHLDPRWAASAPARTAAARRP
ncbi:MAG TPA: hypothetical protein VGH99_13980 [Pseudonocardia sp.]|jgi:hypothetical protein